MPSMMSPPSGAEFSPSGPESSSSEGAISLFSQGVEPSSPGLVASLVEGVASGAWMEALMGLNGSLSTSDVFGYAAVSISLFAAWPQVIRMIRTRNTEGVSWTSTVLGLLCVIVWLVYGLSISDKVQILNNSLALASALALCVLLVIYAKPKIWSALLVVAAVTASILAIWAGTGAAGVAVAASALAIGRMFPQVKLVMGNGSLFGLCPWSTLLGLSSSVLWLAYGLAVDDMAVTVTSLLAAAISALITIRRLPPVRTVRSLANGRLGPVVATAARPVAQRLR